MKYKFYPEYKDSGLEWIETIPKTWKIRRIKRLGSLSTSSVDKKSNPEEIKIKLVNYMDVYKSVDKKIDSSLNFMNVTARPQQLVSNDLKSGDILFTPSSETPDDIGNSAVVFEDLKNTLHSYHLIRLRFNEEIKLTLNYKRYLFNNHFILNQFSSKCVGITRMILGIPGFGESYSLIPPLEDQKLITNFLDKKTSEIDKTIEKDTQLIELLKEKRIALINHVVTKGLDVDARMKDSGVEWIGEIPETWKVVPLTKFLESKVDYRGKTPEKVDEGVFLVTGKNIKNGKIDYEKSQEYVREELYNDIMSRGKPKIGDLLFTTEAPLGEVANVDYPKIALAQRIIKMCGKEGVLNNYYLKYYMMSNNFQGHLQSLATGSTALGIKASKLFILRLILPPYKEQLKIVKRLDEIDKKSSITVQKIENKIELMEEYKKSLIHHVVTGKVDVRGEDSLKQIHQKKDSKQTSLTI